MKPCGAARPADFNAAGCRSLRSGKPHGCGAAARPRHKPTRFQAARTAFRVAAPNRSPAIWAVSFAMSANWLVRESCSRASYQIVPAV
jgi:hypothetical protein